LLPENFEGLERGVLDAANLLRSRKENDDEAWGANDAGEKKEENETLDQLEVHLRVEKFWFKVWSFVCEV